MAAYVKKLQIRTIRFVHIAHIKRAVALPWLFFAYSFTTAQWVMP